MKVAAFESDTLAIILVYNIVFLTVVILIQIIVTATSKQLYSIPSLNKHICGFKNALL